MLEIPPDATVVEQLIAFKPLKYANKPTWTPKPPINSKINIQYFCIMLLAIKGKSRVYKIRKFTDKTIKTAEIP